MTFNVYLQQNQYSEATIRTYAKYLQLFTDWQDKAKLHTDAVTYTELLGFMEQLQQTGCSRDTISTVLCVLRHFFNYQIAERQRGDNPAAGIFIKGIVRRLPGNLLSPEQLQELYDQYRIQLHADLSKRVMLGLLIYQGLTVREIRRLEAADVRIKEGKVFIRGGRCYNERWLKLDAAQIKLLDLYLQGNGHQSTLLAIKKKRFLSVHNISNQVQQMFKHLKKLNPAIINVHQIRSSVITQWLKHYNLRQVQYMAGHRYVSSTQRYQTSHLEDLQTQLQQHHPLEIGHHYTSNVPHSQG